MNAAERFIGGNSLEVAPPGKVRDFVAESGGHTVITKVLIANNGIAAVKEIRSVRKWAYETFGDEKAIEFVVMATPEDLKVNAEYIRMADQYVEVPGGSNNNNYANVELIVDIAERVGAHAVWAGWGHASENPKLPESLALSKTKTVFIGPPGSSMRSLGDKISSTIVAQSANVPTMPWSGTGVSETTYDENGFLIVPDDIYAEACVEEWNSGLNKAKSIGFPVMIKASEGGGGKGIRKVETEEDFEMAFKQVQGEVPGSPIFIMKLAGDSRHLEVQVLADQYGNAISLFGRDCSVQRRHQKIIEEAPVTIAGTEKFEEMEKAAVRLAKLVGYVSTGTVEYLYQKSQDKFFFLELNPRLQVEHPCTEMVSGVNLPASQLQVAMGIPLHRIKDIRLLYGLAPNDTTEIDFDFSKPASYQTQRKPSPKGHVVAVRITAENPDAGFKPNSGMMHELNFRSSTNVWGYFSVNAAGGLHEFADSQFGHIFAYGENRVQAKNNMVIALKELSIRGDFRTTIEYLVKLLETQAFTDNTVNTGWLDMLISNKVTTEKPEAMLAVICGAVCKAHQMHIENVQEYKKSLEKGQVPSKETLKTIFVTEFIYDNIRYRFTATRASSDSYTLFLNGLKVEVGCKELRDGGLLVSFDDKSHTIYWREEVSATRLMIDAKTCLLEKESDPTQLRSPSPGKLVRYLVDSGDHVDANQAYAEIEVMKMYMPLVASEAGIVQFVKQPGSALEAGDIIGILTLDDPSRVKLAKPFEGQLPAMKTANTHGNKLHQRFRALYRKFELILDGYDPQTQLQQNTQELFDILRNPELPYLEFSEIVSIMSSRLPPKLNTQIQNMITEFHSKQLEFPSKQLADLINQFREEISSLDLVRFNNNVQPLLNTLESYSQGLLHHKRLMISQLLSKYYEIESLFDKDNQREEDIILSFRDQYNNDLEKVISIVISHAAIANKNKTILALLNQLKPTNENGVLDPYYSEILNKLAELKKLNLSKVALRAREMLIQLQLPSFEERRSQMERILINSVTESVFGTAGEEFRTPSYDDIKDLVVTNFYVFDVLQSFFFHPNSYIKLAALEVYCRRAYHAYNIVDLVYHTDMDPFIVEWQFMLQDTLLEPQVHSSLGGKRVASISDMTMLINPQQNELRHGAIASFSSFDQMKNHFSRIAGIFPSGSEGKETQFRNVLNLVIQTPHDEASKDEILSKKFCSLLNEFKTQLRSHGVRRVTFIVSNDQSAGLFTYREQDDYSEDPTIRHIEPALAYQLELPRLSNFNIKPVSTDNRQFHIYYAIGKENPADCRFFVRALVRPGRLKSTVQTADYLIAQGHRILTDILDGLQILQAEYKNSDCNHLFISFIPTFILQSHQVEEALSGFIDRHGRRLWRQRVTSAEIRFCVKTSPASHPQRFRFVINNVSGFVPHVETYLETTNDKGEHIFKCLDGQNPLHLQAINTPYQTKEVLQPRRFKAHNLGTTYVYDFPELFRQALKMSWNDFSTKFPKVRVPSNFLDTVELVLNDEKELVEMNREPGKNNNGMVAWLFTLYTPEYSNGRRVIVIANDITFLSGSFGVNEDLLFFKATELARKLGIPRIYLSANSGARIGLADEVKNLFKVSWNDETNPAKGFEYLYLTPDDLQKLLQNPSNPSVLYEAIDHQGETRYKITDIIGQQEGLGVENLRGSGMIAGVTSRAYEDIFTATLVTCRSVGIGAYLVRLGQRTIQCEGQPIILTGNAALNKVLGREVYTSNLQLGGTQIMYRNGVSHLTAANDFAGVSHLINWLSFVAEKQNSPLPVLPCHDPIDRKVTYLPPKNAADPRLFLTGTVDPDNSGGWLTGFFDRDSFVETLAGWARTVVTGRARLGGIPVGVIAVETRTIENVIPADPSNAKSEEFTVLEAGQVWYPNSSFKTAQAINDFNKGEQLPLFIFANWRGFSGGQRDMFNEVLKYGSNIVDALTQYKQPVFIYIIPNGELRGGAWVVLDPTINAEMMEMYADKQARAGILEPEGVVEIKFKRPQLVMERLDETYRDLLKQFNDPTLSPQDKASIKARLQQREQFLLPIYHQLTVQFADLHDTPGRMKAKNTISEILDWSTSREYFYHRLRRRLSEESWIKKILAIDSGLSRSQIITNMSNWFNQFFNARYDYNEDNIRVCTFLTDRNSVSFIDEQINLLKQKALERHLSNSFNSTSKQIVMDSLLKVYENLSEDEKSYLRSHLERS